MYVISHCPTNDVQLSTRTYEAQKGPETTTYTLKRQIKDKTRAVYATDAGTVSQGILSNFNQYIKGSKGKDEQHEMIGNFRRNVTTRKNQMEMLVMQTQ